MKIIRAILRTLRVPGGYADNTASFRPVAIALLVLFALAGAAFAGEVRPGVVFYANSGDAAAGWSTVGKVMAPFGATATTWTIGECRVGPCGNVVSVQPGGSATVANLGGAGFGVVRAPEAGASTPAVTAQIRFLNGEGTGTTFTLGAVTFRLEAASERLRLGPFANRDLDGDGVADEITTLTAYSQADTATAAMAFVYDASGTLVDNFYLTFAPRGVIQRSYSAVRGSFTIQVAPGCNVGPCPAGMPQAYIVATNGPPSASSLEVSYGEPIYSTAAAWAYTTLDGMRAEAAPITWEEEVALRARPYIAPEGAAGQ